MRESKGVSSEGQLPSFSASGARHASGGAAAVRATSESGCEGGTQGLRAATGGGLLCPPLRKKRKPSYDSPGACPRLVSRAA